MENILSLATDRKTKVLTVNEENFEQARCHNSRKSKKLKNVTDSLWEDEINLKDVTTKQQIVEEPTNPSLLFFVTNNNYSQKPKKYECSHCGRSFSKQMYLISHSLKHTSQRLFQCSHCNQNFKHKASLSLHMKIHLTESSSKKEKGDKSISRYSCEKCNKNCQTRQSFEAHLFMHNNERPYKCNLCPKSFLYKHALNKHALSHVQVKKEKKYKCIKCEKRYEFKSEFIRHYAHHSEERSWLCTICGKRYPLQATLKTHLKIHTPGKAYECDTCKSTFMKKSVLEVHIKKVHNKESPSFMCDRCPKQFYNLDGLKQHMIIHLDEKKYKCDVCLKHFSTKSRFLAHRKKNHEL